MNTIGSIRRFLVGLTSGLMCLLASAAPTGSIFFGSDNTAGANAQLILNGGAFTLKSADSGWYRATGVHSPSNTNYIVGLCSDCGPVLFRDFFVFDIPAGIAITSAELSLNTFTYDSNNPSETFTLFDIETNLTTLLSGAGGTSAYDDLGSGSVYGSRVYSAGDANVFRGINLNASAVAALQSSVGGQFALGGSLESPNVGVPEPMPLALVSLALVGLGVAQRRRA